MVNPLICSPSPRDMPDVQKEMDKIKCDKVFCKYTPEWLAYKRLREFFLNYKQYTHMVICPDDLVVTSEIFEKLRGHVERHEKEWPVLAGVCNLSWQDQDRIAACWNIGYQFITVEEVDRMLEDGIGPVIEVGHEGFACTWIRRDVVETIELKGEHWELTGIGRAFDYAFTRQCNIRRIPIRADLTAKMIHYSNRKGDGTLEYSGLGKHPHEIRYYTDEVIPYDVSEYTKKSYNPITNMCLYGSGGVKAQVYDKSLEVVELPVTLAGPKPKQVPLEDGYYEIQECKKSE